ncbi:hypothetical protein QSJ18_17450 [Gordonia sp. ABSL1-1]|uniref:hypothetical protein n=1 Tax=Gordonia sp. ABSL1-1 TaxID=3053923 RepID=UPI00257456A1|nr:hypothetical protein [Gordonia sp. ABSL1-1]MDL9938534.1 hypothetical protein [Gordonia sp. ABSL1-1]
MKKQLVGGLVIGAAAVVGIGVGAADADAQIDPGTYRYCTGTPSVPGSAPECAVGSAQHFIDEAQRVNGYGAFVSTRSGGYQSFAVLGAENGRKVYRRTATGYDVIIYSYGIEVGRATMTKIGPGTR